MVGIIEHNYALWWKCGQPPEQNQRLIDGLVTEKICRRAGKLLQLEMDDGPDDVWPLLLEWTC